ncbi:transposase, partial [Flavobacterium muglaense]
YMNRENRKFLKDRNIRHTGKPLGRKPKEDLSRYEKTKLKNERGERNHIEGKFGQGKSKYKLNKIMARLAQTSESWIGAIFFVMNILKLSKEYFWLFLNGLILSLFLRNPNYESDYLVKLNPVI